MCVYLTSVLVPVDGGWSEWSHWGSCDRACGKGHHTRHRYCNQPIPKHGGKGCQGDWQAHEVCNKEKCPGEWLLSYLLEPYPSRNTMLKRCYMDVVTS